MSETQSADVLPTERESNLRRTGVADRNSSLQFRFSLEDGMITECARLESETKGEQKKSVKSAEKQSIDCVPISFEILCQQRRSKTSMRRHLLSHFGNLLVPVISRLSLSLCCCFCHFPIGQIGVERFERLGQTLSSTACSSDEEGCDNRSAPNVI